VNGAGERARAARRTMRAGACCECATLEKKIFEKRNFFRFGARPRVDFAQGRANRPD
jgi:hypothetical protein